MVVSVAGAMHDSSETNDTSADDVASVALRDVEFCVLDLETTGGSSEFEAITEIGAVKYRGGEEIGRFATLVNPLRAIPLLELTRRRAIRLTLKESIVEVEFQRAS